MSSSDAWGVDDLLVLTEVWGDLVAAWLRLEQQQASREVGHVYARGIQLGEGESAGWNGCKAGGSWYRRVSAGGDAG